MSLRYETKVTISKVPQNITEAGLKSIFENCEISNIERKEGKINLTLKHSLKFENLRQEAVRKFKDIFIQPCIDYSRIAIILNNDGKIPFNKVKEYLKRDDVIWILNKKKKYLILFDSENSRNSFLSDQTERRKYNFVTQDELKLNQAIYDMQYKIFIDNVPPDIKKNDIREKFSSSGISKIKLEDGKCIIKYDDQAIVRNLLQSGPVTVKGHVLDVCIHVDPQAINDLQDTSNFHFKEFESLLTNNPTYLKKIKSENFNYEQFLKNYFTRIGIIGDLNAFFIQLYNDTYPRLKNGISLFEQLCKFNGEQTHELITFHLKNAKNPEERLNACNEIFREFLSNKN